MWDDDFDREYEDDRDMYDDGDQEPADGDYDEEFPDTDEEIMSEPEDGWYMRLPDGTSFADLTGVSALRAATASNPRNLPCPTCGEPNRLTPADRRCGYQCDSCADRDEGGGY